MIFKLPMLTNPLQTLGRWGTELRRFNFIDGDALPPKSWELNPQIQAASITSGSPQMFFPTTQIAKYRFLGKNELFFMLMFQFNTDNGGPGLAGSFSVVEVDLPPGVRPVHVNFGPAYFSRNSAGNTSDIWIAGEGSPNISIVTLGADMQFPDDVIVKAVGTMFI